MRAEGILNKRMAETSLEKVNDAILTQSMFGRLFGFGDLDILTAADEMGGIEDYPMIADPVDFKVAMLNQKEAIERPDLAHPAYQRQAAPPDLVPAEPMPPRAGSDRVTGHRRVRAAPAEAAAPDPAPAPPVEAPPPTRRRRCGGHPRAPRLAARPRPDHLRGIRRQEARAPGADLAWPGDRPRPTWASGSRPPPPPSASGWPPSPHSPRLTLASSSGRASARWSTSSIPSRASGFPYADIPEVPVSGVPGHAGELVAGLVNGKPVLVLAGRVHAYEGYSHREVTILIRATFRVGIQTVVLTNAAGGLDPGFEPGELMLVTDHINLSGDNPLFGPNIDALGPRFPALTDAYDPELAARARAAAERTGVRLHEGVYVMLSGPSYETRAELRMLRGLGGDAVGMSTALEVIVARHAGVRVLAISLDHEQGDARRRGRGHARGGHRDGPDWRPPHDHPLRHPAAGDRLGVLFLGGLSLPALLGIVLGMLAGITAHEFSHAFVADQLGDHRLRALGRVSLNPLRHLDPLGTALLVLVGIGWGKPVPVAVEALRPGRIGMAYVAAAGPVANVVVALILAGAFRALDLAGLGGMGRELAVPGGRDQPPARDPEPHPHPAARRLRGRDRPRSASLGVRHPPVPGLRDRAPAPAVHRAQQPAERGPGPRLPVGRGSLRDLSAGPMRPDLPRAPVPRPPVRAGLARRAGGAPTRSCPRPRRESSTPCPAPTNGMRSRSWPGCGRAARPIRTCWPPRCCMTPGKGNRLRLWHRVVGRPGRSVRARADGCPRLQRPGIVAPPVLHPPSPRGAVGPRGARCRLRAAGRRLHRRGAGWARCAVGGRIAGR